MEGEILTLKFYLSWHYWSNMPKCVHFYAFSVQIYCTATTEVLQHPHPCPYVPYTFPHTSSPHPYISLFGYLCLFMRVQVFVCIGHFLFCWCFYCCVIFQAIPGSAQGSFLICTHSCRLREPYGVPGIKTGSVV